MKKELNKYEFAQEFKNMDRDYYSQEGYDALFDYYDELENFDLDVIAICVEVSEYDEEEIKNTYSHILEWESFEIENKDLYDDINELQNAYMDELVSELEQNTTLIKLDNGSFLVWDF